MDGRVALLHTMTLFCRLCQGLPTRRQGVKGVQDNRAMHIVISHAAAPGPRCRAASAALQLPHLQALLRQAGAQTLHNGGPESLTPLAEHLASGQTYADGLVPWAAWLAQGSGLDQNGQHWALISPCHLQIHSDHVAMQDPDFLQLSEDESRTLLAAMQPYFEEDGIQLHWHSAHTWLAQGPVFQELASASLARVRGQPTDPWIPRQSAAQNLRRLQNEMQMLLYTHAVNDARSARGQVPVNGFWMSGTGSPLARADAPRGAASPSTKGDAPLGAENPLTGAAAPHGAAKPLPMGAAPQMRTNPLHALLPPASAGLGPVSPHALYINTLDASALRDDPEAWVQAWQTLDAQVFAPLAARQASSPDISISLCGEQRARTWVSGRASLWQRIKQQLAAPGLHPFVHDL
jgi:hypothetical protein